MSEHDPIYEPEVAHSRARELMAEPFFWDSIDEFAPFGSDEGFDAYYEWRRWCKDNPSRSLRDCLSWILNDQLDGYNDTLHSDESIKRDIANPDGAFLADHYDMFTLDTTIIATALGQLLDEGKIDEDAKIYVNVAINRQLHSQVCKHKERRDILLAVKRVVDAV